MQLYLMQHGQAVPETENPEQPLSREGVATIRASAAALKRLGLSFDLIVCSPKKRSHQSAALVAEGVNYPYSDIAETAAVKPTAPAEEALAYLRRHVGCQRVLVAGHLPSLADLAALLLGAPVRLRFEHGGLCRLDAEEPAPGAAELVWHLPAAVLRLLAN
jgi:phosphohistidine phosphatase